MFKKIAPGARIIKVEEEGSDMLKMVLEKDGRKYNVKIFADCEIDDIYDEVSVYLHVFVEDDFPDVRKR